LREPSQESQSAKQVQSLKRKQSTHPEKRARHLSRNPPITDNIVKMLSTLKVTSLKNLQAPNQKGNAKRKDAICKSRICQSAHPKSRNTQQNSNPKPEKQPKTQRAKLVSLNFHQGKVST
jgi:hypothetical protein